MFYSHEILTSQKYGVATVWLVSTIGLRVANRKISRKAIQEVDVQGTCETILRPGAPIALRLQGNLLYGVSKVFSQQCTYVLNDAERVQTHMRTFCDSLGDNNALDPSAGKAKRENLMLPDDPDFEIDFRLPGFILDEDGNLSQPGLSQASRKTSSQLSPLERGSLSLIGSGGGSLVGILDIPDASSQIRSSHGFLELEQPKADAEELVFGEDELMGDWGIEIDAEGNVITVVEEPELPPLPRPEPLHRSSLAVQQRPSSHLGNQGDVVMSDPIILDADQAAQPQQAVQGGQVGYSQPEVADPSSEIVIAPVRRQRQPAPLAPDMRTMVSRRDMRDWDANYLERAARTGKRRVAGAVQARQNAFQAVFGRGLADVGIPIGMLGLVNPLAETFAGNWLKAHLLGIPVDDEDQPANGLPRRHGRRRPAFEALELEDEEEERRVRPRLSSEEVQNGQAGGQQSLAHLDDEQHFLPGEEDVEAGREAAVALPDILSDNPWTRHSSQVPSSSIKGGRPGSNKQFSASPLRGRGTQIPYIERDSDLPVLGSDDSDGGGSQLGGFNGSSPPRSGEKQGTSQIIRDALDHEGIKFLDYLESVTQKNGDVRDDGRRWVDFEALFEQRRDRTKVVAAQAFYHVLQLATRDVIRVHQEGLDLKVPFGIIWLGLAGQGGEEMDGA